MDWTTLLTPLIVALVPILVAGAKHWIPERYAVLYPVLATSLGPVLDYLSTYLSQLPASPGRGVLLGMAGVAVREIADQLRKLPAKPAVKGMILLALVPPFAGGCVLPPVHIYCKGKGVLSFQGGPYAGMVSGDCGDGFEYKRAQE